MKLFMMQCYDELLKDSSEGNLYELYLNHDLTINLQGLPHKIRIANAMNKSSIFA